MKKIAVICARSILVNPGMHTVEMAFETIAKRLSQPANITYFHAQAYATDQPSGKTGVAFEALHSQSQLLEFDLIVYWGDFVHSLTYARQDWKIMADQLSSEAYRLDQWFKLFLLEDAPPELKSRTIIFGGTLYGLSAAQLREERYRTALTDLYSRARLVLMRDHVSAHFVAEITPQQTPGLGCDCALLLERQLPEAGQRQFPNLQEKYVIGAFQRSGANHLQHALTQELAIRMGFRAVFLDWFGTQTNTGGLAKMLDLIHQAEFVVTDIYHFSINAWREGTPALCVGRGASYPTSTLSDKKKEIFYRQIYATDYYLFLEDVLTAIESDQILAQYCSKLQTLLQDEIALSIVFETLQRQSVRAAARLLAAIDESGTTRPA